jgi:hypothetical protein
MIAMEHASLFPETVSDGERTRFMQKCAKEGHSEQSKIAELIKNYIAN